MILRAVQIPLSFGPSRLIVRRQDGAFSFKLSQGERLRAEVTFRPILPGPVGGRFGWIWPAGARLRACASKVGQPPASPSPLEQGDALVSRLEFRRAAEVYARQARSADPSGPGRSTRLDALTKEAFCLVEIGERREARELLKALTEESSEVATASNEQGPDDLLLANLLRWQLLVEPGDGQDYREAATILKALSSRYRLGPPDASEDGDGRIDIAGRVPEEMRGRIVAAYRDFTGPLDLVTLRGDLLDRRRDAVEVESFFGSPTPMRLGRMFDALEIEWVLRQTQDARNRAEEIRTLVDRGHALGEVGPGMAELAVRRVCWMERATGQVDAATRLLDHWSRQTGTTGPDWELIRLIWSLERARNLATAGNGKAALVELDRFFSDFDRLADESKRYGLYAPACLLHGYLLEAQRERDGARRAWVRGLARGKAWIDLDPTAALAIPRGYHAFLAVLAEDPDADRQIEGLVSEVRGWLPCRTRARRPPSTSERCANREGASPSPLWPKRDLNGSESRGDDEPRGTARKRGRLPQRSIVWRRRGLPHGTSSESLPRPPLNLPRREPRYDDACHSIRRADLLTVHPGLGSEAGAWLGRFSIASATETGTSSSEGCAALRIGFRRFPNGSRVHLWDLIGHQENPRIG